MSEKLKRSWPLLLLLQKVKPKLRKILLEDLADNPEMCVVIREIFVNYLNGNIKLSQSEREKLKRYSKLCKLMASKSKRKQRKKTFKQVGGLPLLPLLINAAIPIITSLLTN